MQFRVRLALAPALREGGFVLWALARDSLELILESWPSLVTWEPVVPQTFATCQKCEYHPTAIARPRPAAPIRAFLAAVGTRGKRAGNSHRRVLYHGVGRDDGGAQALGLRGDEVALYDPYHPSVAVRTPPAGHFDEIHSVYVLCVVDMETGRRILRALRAWLAPTGIAVISVRR